MSTNSISRDYLSNKSGFELVNNIVHCVRPPTLDIQVSHLIYNIVDRAEQGDQPL